MVLKNPPYENMAKRRPRGMKISCGHNGVKDESQKTHDKSRAKRRLLNKLCSDN